jgi:F-type H+-transporting ATPase subunit delta
MAELSTLARPYAKALFDLAKEKGQLPEWSVVLRVLATEVQNQPLKSLLGHPSFKREELTAYINDKLHFQGESAALVALLAQNQRLSALPEIASQYETLRRKAEAMAEVEITSAVSLAEGEQEAIRAAIAQRLQAKVDVSWKVDGDLIAGAVVRSGDLVIDGSFKGELARLRQALIR